MLRKTEFDTGAYAGAPSKPLRRQPLIRVPGLEFTALRCDDISPAACPMPVHGKLVVWRLHAEWQAVSRDSPRASVSAAEQARAKHYRNPALAKRYLVGRAALRHLLSAMLAQPASEVPLVDGAAGQPGLEAQNNGQDIALHVAYAGIWILVAVGASPLGIGAVVPAPGRSPREYLPGASAVASALPPLILQEPATAQEHARRDSVSALLGEHAAPVLTPQGSGAALAVAADGRQCHVLDLPMPGRIHAAVALAQPVTNLLAIGWTRR